MAEKTKILPDHKKIGQRLISPLNLFMASRLNEFSWANRTLPELLWIGLIQRRIGVGPGVKLINAVARAAHAVHSGPEHRFFVTISNFSILSESQKDQLRAHLASKPAAAPSGCGASRYSPLWFLPWQLSAMWLGGLVSPPPRFRASSIIRRR